MALAVLTRFGVEDAQGYLLARPLPAAAFAAAVHAWRPRRDDEADAVTATPAPS